MKKILLLIASLVCLETLASTNTLTLSWQCNTPMGNVLNGVNPKGANISVTNPPITFYFFNSTNLNNWQLLTTAVNTTSASVKLDTACYNYIMGVSSNSTYGASAFSTTLVWVVSVPVSVLMLK